MFVVVSKRILPGKMGSATTLPAKPSQGSPSVGVAELGYSLSGTGEAEVWGSPAVCVC